MALRLTSSLLKSCNGQTLQQVNWDAWHRPASLSAGQVEFREICGAEIGKSQSRKIFTFVEHWLSSTRRYIDAKDIDRDKCRTQFCSKSLQQRSSGSPCIEQIQFRLQVIFIRGCITIPRKMSQLTKICLEPAQMSLSSSNWLPFVLAQQILDIGQVVEPRTKSSMPDRLEWRLTELKVYDLLLF